MSKKHPVKDWMQGHLATGKERDSLPQIDPSFFIRGGEYHTDYHDGAITNIVYKCVHVGTELVIFTFTYQGRERSRTEYFIDMKEGDYKIASTKS